jgi:hypothetical protein
MARFAPCLVFASVLAASACGSSPQLSNVSAPHLTEAEVNEDLDAMVSQVRRLYGPLEFKQDRFGWTLDGLVADAKAEIAAGTTDTERLGALVKFLGRFEDGHVGIRFPGNASEVRAYKIDIFLTPVQGQAVVESVGPDLAAYGIARGDVLTSIDGKAPWDLLPTIKQYQMFANDVSDEHFIVHVLNRPFYMAELIPTAPIAELVLTRADGTTYTIRPLWTKQLDDPKPLNPVAVGRLDFAVPEAAQGNLNKFGAYKPYFVTSQSAAAVGLIEVEPNAAFLAKYGVTREELTDAQGFAIYAALYKHAGKTVLMVRQPSYSMPFDAAKLIKGYKAVLDQYDGLADVLVIDQTHNPGGSIDYLTAFYKLFVTGEKPNMVQFMNADRRWVYNLRLWAEYDATVDPIGAQNYRLGAEIIDATLDAGLSMTEAPMPLSSTHTVSGDAEYTWTKPILVLADELAGSCGDIFPMLMQRGGTAKVFGERTMGLGGNVENVITLPNSQASVRLTRGLFVAYEADGNYAPEAIVENNGVTPDIPHKITLSDFRGGFADYLRAVSDAAVAQIQ